MKHKTAELDGNLLDAAVAKVGGQETRRASDGSVEVSILPDWDGTPDWDSPIPFSSEWRYGGPIIEEYGIEIQRWNASTGTRWIANVGGNANVRNPPATGPTALIAAMRALVRSRLGEEVEL